MKPKTVKRMKWMAIVLTVLCGVYILALVVTSAKVRQAYRALEEDNRPMHVDEIVPERIEDPLNAALLYNSALALLKSEPVGTSSLLSELGDYYRNTPPEDTDPNRQAEIETWLGHPTVAQAIDLTERGARKWGCYYDLNYEDGVNINLSHLSEFRKLTVILLAKAEAAAAANHPERAWQLAQVSLDFAEGIRAEPLIVNQLVRMAQIRRTLTTMRILCQTSLLDDKERAALQSRLLELEDVAPLVKAMDGERLLFGEWFYTKPVRELGTLLGDCGVGNEGNRWLFGAYARLGRPIFHLDHALYLESLHNIVGRLQQPYHALGDDDFEDRVDQSPRFYILFRTLVPALSRVRVLHARMVAELRLMSLGLDLWQYHRVHGKFPETNDQLPSEGRDDPFTGESMRYQRQGSGFLLYSLDVDRQDEGGEPKAKGRETWDITWKFSPASEQ